MIIENLPHTDKLAKAAFFCVAAHFSFFIMGLFGKQLSSSHHVIEISFYRNIIVFIPMLIFVLLSKKMHLLHTKKPFLMLLRAVIGTSSLICVFATLHHLPMAYTTVIFFASALFAPVFSLIFLKEAIGVHRAIAIIIGFAGVIIVARPSGEFSFTGLMFGLTTAFLHGVIFTILRALKTESPFTVTFYFVLGGAILTAIALPWIGKPISHNEIIPYLLLGLSGGAGQLLLAGAYKYAPASFVAPFGYSSLLWNVLADFFYWKYQIEIFSILIGTAFILGAQLYIIYREYIKNR